MTWSSYPQHQLMVEGFRDFFKRKKKPSATYPASELTTIVNLISNLAKKFSIQVDTGAIVDEFEAMLKSQNIDLQEQDDRLMIGADLNLTLDSAPELKKFMIDLNQNLIFEKFDFRSIPRTYGERKYVAHKLPQICTVIWRICIGKVA